MKVYPKTAFQRALASRGACDDARKWVGSKTLAEAWAKCRRGDWLLWLADSAGAGDVAAQAQASVLPRGACCAMPSCSGRNVSGRVATAIRKAIPLSVIRAGLK